MKIQKAKEIFDSLRFKETMYHPTVGDYTLDAVCIIDSKKEIEAIKIITSSPEYLDCHYEIMGNLNVGDILFKAFDNLHHMHCLITYEYMHDYINESKKKVEELKNG